MSLTNHWVVLAPTFACCYLEFIFSVAKWGHILFFFFNWHWGFLNEWNFIFLGLFFFFVVAIQTYFVCLFFWGYFLISFFDIYSLDWYWIIFFYIEILGCFGVRIHFQSASSFSLSYMFLKLFIKRDDVFTFIEGFSVKLLWFIY